MATDIRNAPRAKTGGLQSIWTTSQIPLDMPMVKQINTGEDIDFFFSSKGYADIMTFVLQLNSAMFARTAKSFDADGNRDPTSTDEVTYRSNSGAQQWQTDSVHIMPSPQVMKIKVLIQTLKSMTHEAKPVGPAPRFGSPAFRTWHKMVEVRLPELLMQSISSNVLSLIHI